MKQSQELINIDHMQNAFITNNLVSFNSHFTTYTRAEINSFVSYPHSLVIYCRKKTESASAPGSGLIKLCT